MATTTDTAVMTKAEAAAFLRCSQRTFDRWWEKSGLVAKETPEGRPRFLRADVESLLTDRRPSED